MCEAGGERREAGLRDGTATFRAFDRYALFKSFKTLAAKRRRRFNSFKVQWPIRNAVFVQNLTGEMKDIR
jgi:hypothetical protein